MAKEHPTSDGIRVLVVDDEATLRRTLAISLEADGHSVVAVGNSRDAIVEVSRHSFDLAFVDLRLGVSSGMDLIPELLAASPWLKVIVITAHGSIDVAVEAMKRGAADFLPKPFLPAQVRLVTERVAKMRAMEQRLAGVEASSSDPVAMLDSASPAMRRSIEMARQVAASEAVILLRGESGTGKGVIARAIHGWSGRSTKPFVTISAPSLSPQLLESELFGHVKGAFTGAVRDNPGRIATAESGTLFLDEIGDLPLELQPKLLHFLQERQYERVGDSAIRRADVRLITATNVDLDQAVREKRFREDLFYRLNVVAIDIPPLRERVDDILPLAERMLVSLRGNRPIRGFSDGAAAVMRRYRWPGNVRELRNVVERAVILATSDVIGPEHLPGSTQSPALVDVALGDPVPFERIEEAHIRRVLAHSKTLEDAAAALDVDLTTLWRKRRKYGI